MLSLSTVGMPACKPPISGCIELAPPISAIATASNLRPICSSSRAHSPHHLGALGQFFDADGGRADTANNAAKRIVGQVKGVDDRLRTFLADDRRQVQAAEVGVATATRAQYAPRRCLSAEYPPMSLHAAFNVLHCRHVFKLLDLLAGRAGHMLDLFL